MRKLLVSFLILALIISSALFGFSLWAKAQLKSISRELLEIREITDFSSNRNYPVAQVQNIGPSLYKILRQVKSKKCGSQITSTVEHGDKSVSKLFLNYFFRFTLYYRDSKSPKNIIRIRIVYQPTDFIFQIRGYSGSLGITSGTLDCS